MWKLKSPTRMCKNLPAAVLIWLLVLYINGSSHGQISLLHQAELPIQLEIQPYVALSDNAIWLLRYSAHQKPTVECYTLYGKNCDKTRMSFSKFLGDSEEIYSFSIIADNLLILTSDYVYQFNIHNKKLLGKSPNNLRYDYVEPIGNNFLLYKNYNYNPRSDTIKTALAIYNTIDKKISHSIEPKFDFYPATHRVGNFISVSGDKILFAKTLTFHISIYNDQLQLIDSIKLNMDDWKNLPINTANDISRSFSQAGGQIKQLIYAFYEVDESISRIEKVMGSDGTILVSFKKPNDKKAKRHIIIFQKRTNGWEIQTTQTIEIEPDTESDAVFIPQPRIADSSPMILSKNQLIIFTTAYLAYPKNLTQKQFYGYQEQFYLKNDSKAGVYIYNINP